MEIYADQYAVMTECIAKSGVSPNEIAAVGITNQRETTVVWDKTTGRPVYNAIVWQCRRTSDICEKIVSDGMEEYIREKTGLRADAYFSASKIKWILDNVDGARKLAEKGDLIFGTIDTWLLWKLTDGRVHITDRTNASRTMLYDLRNNCWDKRLLEYFDIPESMLPEIRSSSEIYGTISIMGLRNTHFRHGRGSAGCDFWAGMFQLGRGKDYIWNRMLSSCAYGRRACFGQQRSDHYGGGFGGGSFSGICA